MAEQVADGVVAGVEEEGGEIVVVAWSTLEVLVVPGAPEAGAFMLGMDRTRCAFCQPWNTIRAA